MVAFVRSLLLILVSSLVSTLLVSADHKADQLIECLDGVSGLDVVLPSDKKAYKNATSVWELKVPQAYPVAVVIPTSAAQIQGAVKCAGAANVRVVPKSGGHNYEGWSVQNGTLSVDLQEMDGVVADKSTGVITAGPVGIDLTDVRAHVLTLSLALRASLVHQVMSVIYQGKTHQIAVREGPEGRELFENDIRKIFGLGTNDELQLSFGVKVPDRRLDGAEDELTLEGWESFDAAVFCASLSAGARNERTKRLGAELETPDKKTLHANKRRSLETPGRVFRRLFGGMIEDEAGR